MKIIIGGASIECERAMIITRKPKPIALVEVRCLHNVVKEMYKYSCSRNSEAIIVKEVNPLIPIVCELSALNLEDTLESDSIDLFVEQARRIKFTKMAHTGRHNAQESSTNDFTYCIITKQIPNIKEIKDPEQLKYIPKME